MAVLTPPPFTRFGERYQLVITGHNAVVVVVT